MVEHQVAGRRVAKDEVSRDVGRPVAPVVADVCCPVAAVGEGSDEGGFGGEGGGGENLPSSRFSSLMNGNRYAVEKRIYTKQNK